MRENEKQQFIELLTSVLDLFGVKSTAASFGLWWSALKRFPLEFVRDALSAHVEDSIAGKFAPKPADIIGRLQQMDGRPGPEESWAMMPRDEAITVVWTEEMQQAWGVALALLNEGDQVAARMAFIERYKQLVQHARNAGRPAKWQASIGTDQAGREQPLLAAMELGRLPAPYVAGLLPSMSTQQSAKFIALVAKQHKALVEIESLVPEEVGQA